MPRLSDSPPPDVVVKADPVRQREIKTKSAAQSAIELDSDEYLLATGKRLGIACKLRKSGRRIPTEGSLEDQAFGFMVSGLGCGMHLFGKGLEGACRGCVYSALDIPPCMGTSLINHAGSNCMHAKTLAHGIVADGRKSTLLRTRSKPERWR